MKEFLDIYKLFTKNFDRDFIEKAWDTEDIEKLRKLLDKICGEIENGHIIMAILKNGLDIWQDIDMIYPLTNVRDAVFRIESAINSKEHLRKPENQEDIKEKQKEKIAVEIKESGKGRGILGDEKPIKRYGAILIYSTIKDYIWDRLPTDFKHADVMAFFKEFYKKKLNRRIMNSSCSTYAGGYIRFYKDQDPSIISWDKYDYSKDIDKYKVVEKAFFGFKEPEKKDRQPKPHSSWKPRELQIIEKHSPSHTAKYIHKKLLPHRTASAIASKSKRLGIKKIRKYEKKRKKKIEIKLWRTEEDDVIKEYHPYMTVEEYVGKLPDRTIDAVNRRASYLKVKKDKDTKQEKAEDVIEDELTKKESVDKRVLTEETKKLLSKEQEEVEEAMESIEKLEKEDKIIEPEPVKTKLDNPFYDGSAEHYLYEIAVKSNWPTTLKKGTPLIMIMRRMAEFSKDEIKNAIDVLVKKRKAQRLPNNSVLFFE